MRSYISILTALALVHFSAEASRPSKVQIFSFSQVEEMVRAGTVNSNDIFEVSAEDFKRIVNEDKLADASWIPGAVIICTLAFGCAVAGVGLYKFLKPRPPPNKNSKE